MQRSPTDSLAVTLVRPQPCRGRAHRTLRGGVYSLLGLLWPALLAAQTVSGVLRMPNGAPVSGVQVVAVELATGRVSARTVVSARGTFRLEIPSLPVRLRALRLGYAPVDLLTLSTTPPAAEPLRLTLPDTPRPLPPLTVVAASRCDTPASAATEVVDAFSAVRGALALVRIDVTDEAPLESVVVLRDRLIDLNNTPLRPTRHQLRSGTSLRPFRAVPADSLFEVGFVVQERDGVTDHGPDSDLLLGEAFLERHCLSFVPTHPDRPAWSGVAFTPVNTRRGVVGIRGVIWIDRVTYHVQRLEFSYVGLPRELEPFALGGSVDFDLLPNGAWFESRWTLRMARTFQRVRSGRLEVEALQIAEGDVVVRRSASGAAFQGDARLAALAAEAERAGASEWEERGDAPEGGDVRVCQSDDSLAAARRGAFGVVYTSPPQRLPDADVRVQWRSSQRLVGDEWRWVDEERVTRADADGFFAVCGLPADESLELIVIADGRERRLRFRLGTGEGDRRLDVTLVPHGPVREPRPRHEPARAHHRRPTATPAARAVHTASAVCAAESDTADIADSTPIFPFLRRRQNRDAGRSGSGVSIIRH